MTLPILIGGALTGSFVAALVGLVGARRHIGFGWAFLLSVIFTPLIGLIVALLSDPLPAGERRFGCLGTALGLLSFVIIFAIILLIMMAL